MDFVQMVKDAGIVGAGGAGFPTHIKLNAKADYFIVNAAECEPLIEVDKYLCRTFAEQIVTAAAATATHLQASHAVIALKKKYHAEIEALQKAIDHLQAPVEIRQMGVFYPAGDEQTMVQFVTGRSVPERGLPLDVGAVVDNVGTLLNIYYALTANTPVGTKYLSVVGEVREPIVLHTPIGTPIRTCIQAAKPNLDDYAVIMGGPMMGKVVSDPDAIDQAVVTKTTGNLLVLPRDHYLIKRAARSIDRLRVQARSACIQCRMCTDLCPRYRIGHQMRPHLVMRNLYREKTITDNEEFLHAFGDAANCCSCGVCEMFACPMGLSPRKVNEYMKAQLREKGIQVPKNPEPTALPDIDTHRIPTDRLIARLGLSAYDGRHAHTCMELDPEEIFVPFSQHIGKPASAVRQVGDYVEEGDLLAAASEGGLSANIHTGMSGIITEISAAGARIVCRKEG